MLAPRFNSPEIGQAASVEGYDLPSVIADHTLIRCIGEGSYGRVYLVRNELTGIYRAMKIVFREAFNDSKPYLREFDAICFFDPISRSHPGFVQILHVGKLENAFYYIMEVGDDVAAGPNIDPETYRPRTLGLSRGEVLPVEKCIEVGSSLADCLSVLHAQGLIHRDIKPSNIIFVNGRPKLADIGLVTQIEEAKSLVGTAGFMPPEGPMDPTSDIYSLGKVLYEIATGKDRCEFPELPGETTAENALHLELNQIILRACHPKANRRYRTAQELRHELDLLHAGKSIKRLRQVERRLKVVKLAFAGSFLIAVGAFLIYSQIKAKREAQERDRQRRAGYLLAEGTSEMRKGDLARALLYFIGAAEHDPRDMRSHQLRVGSMASQVPRLKTHWRSALSGEFSADGKLLAVPENTVVRIYESATGKQIESRDLGARITQAKVSADHSHLAAMSGPRLLVVARTNGSVAETSFEHDLRDFCFHPADGRIAVSLTNGTAYFFDSRTRSTQQFASDGSVWNLSYDRTGQRMITSHEGKHRSHIRDGATGEPLAEVRQELPYRGVFSPDGNTVVICGWTSAVPVKVISGELAGDTMDNDDGVPHAAFSPGGKILATANYDGSVRLWDALRFDPLPINHFLEHESRPKRVVFLDEETLVTHCIDGETYVWSLGIKKPEALSVSPLHLPDPLRIEEADVQLSAEDRSISGYIGTNGISVVFPASVSVLAVDPRRTAFAAGSKDSQFARTEAYLYRLEDLRNPIPLKHKDGINHIAFSHAGDKLVTSSEDFSAIIWDAVSGKRLTRPMRHTWQVMWASFSEDDQWLVTAGSDAVCIVWDARTGQPLTAPLQFHASLFFADFDSDSAAIIVRDKDKNFFRMKLPIAPLPLSQHTRNLPALLEPMRDLP